MFWNAHSRIGISKQVFWNNYSGTTILEHLFQNTYFRKPFNYFLEWSFWKLQVHSRTSFLERFCFQKRYFGKWFPKRPFRKQKKSFWKHVHNVNKKHWNLLGVESWRRRGTFALEPLMKARRREELESRMCCEKKRRTNGMVHNCYRRKKMKKGKKNKKGRLEVFLKMGEARYTLGGARFKSHTLNWCVVCFY